MTKEAVSNLLYEIPISSYLALSIEGVKELTDAVGGVQITVPEDYTEINPLFEKGATLVLNGEQAEQYVRKRDIDKTGSNNERMERSHSLLKHWYISFKERTQAGIDRYLKRSKSMLLLICR